MLPAAALAVLCAHFGGSVLWVFSTVLLGLTSFATVPPLQLMVVQQAEKDAPQAVEVASGLNIAAFNLGITFGAALGGWIVAHSGLIHTAWAGALLLALATAHLTSLDDTTAPFHQLPPTLHCRPSTKPDPIMDSRNAVPVRTRDGATRSTRSPTVHTKDIPVAT